MRLNIPDFDIDTSGVSDALNKITRDYEEGSKRLDRGAKAHERNVEEERKIRRGGAIRGFAGRVLLGGLSVKSELATANNKMAVNEMVNNAQKEYEKAFVKFDAMSPAEKNEFLNSGGFEDINDALMDELDQDIYGVNTNEIKDRWNAQFRANYMRIQISTQKALKKEQEARLERLRFEFRNKIIADPYSPDAQNGKMAADFRNSISGLVDSIEEADVAQTYEQIYGLLTGFSSNEDHEAMTEILDMDVTKQVLGDEYERQIKERDKIKRRKEKEGDTKFKISGFKDSMDIFSQNFNTAQLVENLSGEGFGEFGRALENNILTYVQNQNNESVDGLDVSELHKHIPNRANRSQQVKIHKKTQEIVKAVQEAFEKDPVDTYMRVMAKGQAPYIQPAERGLIYENTGRILTNQEVTNNANVLVNAFALGFKQFEVAHEAVSEVVGTRGLQEIYSMMPEIMKGTDAQKKNYLKLIRLHNLPEVLKQLPLPEARQAIANGVTPPTSIDLRGLGNAHNKSWSNNEDLMDVIKILAMHRTFGDEHVREGQGKVDSEMFAAKYWRNFNEIVDDYDSNFETTTEGYVWDSEGKGRGGTHLVHIAEVGKSIDPQGYEQSQETFENNLTPQYFERYGRNIFSQETIDLLRREDVKVEADLHNGAYRFYMSVPRGEVATPLSYEIKRKNGQAFKLPVPVMYQSGGKIFQNLQHYDPQMFDPVKNPEIDDRIERERVPDNIVHADPSIQNLPEVKNLSKGQVFSSLHRAMSEPNIKIPTEVLQPVMLKLMFRESRFDKSAVEAGVTGRPAGRGILQLTSPHLTKGIDPHDNWAAIHVGTQEVNRLYEQGLKMAKEYNQKRVQEGEEPLDFTHGDVMMYAIKAWNGGGVDSPKGFNMQTIIKAYEGTLSNGGPVDKFASSIMHGLATLSPEEEAQVNKKENEQFYNIFSFDVDKRVKEWMDSPIESATREPAGVQVPFMLGALLNIATLAGFKGLFKENPENYQEWLERNGLPLDTPYKEAWEWHKKRKENATREPAGIVSEVIKDPSLLYKDYGEEAKKMYNKSISDGAKAYNRMLERRVNERIKNKAEPFEDERRRKEKVDEVPLWQYKDIKADSYKKYTDKFLEDWFDRIEGVGPLTSKQLQDFFRNFKLGYKGQVFSK